MPPGGPVSARLACYSLQPGTSPPSGQGGLLTWVYPQSPLRAALQGDGADGRALAGTEGAPSWLKAWPCGHCWHEALPAEKGAAAATWPGSQWVRRESGTYCGLTSANDTLCPSSGNMIPGLCQPGDEPGSSGPLQSGKITSLWLRPNLMMQAHPCDPESPAPTPAHS